MFERRRKRIKPDEKIALRLTRISHRFRETGLAGARNEIFMVWGRQRLSVGPP